MMNDERVDVSNRPPLERPSTLRTPLSLLLRLSRGNDADWRMFYGIYGPIVYGLARDEGLSESDADDVLARVMRGLFRRVQSKFEVNPERGHFRHYVAAATRNAVAAQRRAFKGSGRGLEDLDAVPDDGGSSPEERILALERFARLRQCLDLLRDTPDVRPRDLEAFERYALAGEPADRVARRMGMTRERLYGVKSEMMDRIRKMLARMDVELGEV